MGMSKLKNLIIAFTPIFIFTAVIPASAKDYELSGYTETGKRSNAEDYEEEDSDDDYTYHNYHLRFRHDVSETLKYNIGSFIYDKDYKYSDSADNISKIFRAGMTSYLSRDENDSLRFNLGFDYKTKRYDSTPNSEFNQVIVSPGFTFTKENRHAVDFDFGLNSIDYLKSTNKNLVKRFARLSGKKYFDDKKLMFVSSVMLEQADQSEAGRKKNKLEFEEGLDYKFKLPWMDKITTRFKWGDRDTRDDEERSVDYDYGYFRWHVKTDHKISSKIKTDLKFQFFKKDYITAIYDHKGYYILNGWDYDLFNDSEKRIWFNLEGEHKDVRYDDRLVSDYKKETAGLTASYQRKKDWKVSAGTKGNFYDYRADSGDKKRYYALLSGEKLFLEWNLTAVLDLKYRRTEQEVVADTDYEAVRLAFEYGF